ncbi:MAG TPA: sugar phosphate nucleotidyltransferase [Longimicrobiales bacterium]|nr:sugar phosphate nucleotidyltransferase [Longimicrobiales bacterium]
MQHPRARAGPAVPSERTPTIEGYSVKVVIPLAGKGTRLRPHTYVTPKPLLNVGGRPVMSYILDDLKELGVREIVFVVGYLKEKIESYVADAYPEFTSHFVEQKVQDGTAGAVGLARDFIDEDLLILFVDTIFDANLSIIRDLPEDVAGIMWVKEVEDYQRFGVVVTGKDGFMKRIVEKPKDPISKLANIGLYYIRDWKLLFEGIRQTLDSTRGAGQEYYLTDAFQFMIDHGAKIKIVEVDGWYDAGKPDTLLETNRHLLETGRARAPDGGHNVRVTEPVRVEEGVVLENSEIGPNVTIMTGSTIRGSKVRDAIIGAGTTIEDSELHDSLIGDQCVIRGARGSLSVVDHSEIVGCR